MLIIQQAFQRHFPHWHSIENQRQQHHLQHNRKHKVKFQLNTIENWLNISIKVLLLVGTQINLNSNWKISQWKIANIVVMYSKWRHFTLSYLKQVRQCFDKFSINLRQYYYFIIYWPISVSSSRNFEKKHNRLYGSHLL